MSELTYPNLENESLGDSVQSSRPLIASKVFRLPGPFIPATSADIKIDPEGFYNRSPKKSLADTLREQAWSVNQKSGGGIVITGVAPQPTDLTLIPGKPSSESLAAMIKKFTGKEPDPVEHAAAMARIDAAFEAAKAAKKPPE